jgi:hypothetical protein
LRRVLPVSIAAADSSPDTTSIGRALVEIVDDGGRRLGSITFESEGPYRIERRLPPAKQEEFKADFCREMARLEKWAADLNWGASSVSEFRVVISGRYKISKSLVPAWSGRAGHMEFPLWRVLARKAAIAHELVHVFFPNGNRLLAEGLAVYLQAAIGGNPAFPNFGKPLHENVRERFLEMAPDISRGDKQSLEQIHLAELDTIATPSPLTLRVGHEVYGEEPRGQAFIYPIAGSFVQFLVETHGLDMFRALYGQTRLVPLTQIAGSPERWAAVYGVPLDDLENEWKAMIADGFPASDSCEAPADRICVYSGFRSDKIKSSSVVPAKAGTQYATALLGLLGRPVKPGDDT